MSRSPLVLRTLAFVVAAAVAGAATAQEPGDRKRPRGRSVPALLTPDDPAIPSPAEIDANTDVRLFVESFLVGLARHDLDVVYDTYFHTRFQESLDREAFKRDTEMLRSAVGKLEKSSIVYLRAENGAYDGVDGGWSNHLLIFERDPQVEVRIEFRRAGDGWWKIVGYALRSVQMERLARARAASEGRDGDPQSSPREAEPPSPRP